MQDEVHGHWLPGRNASVGLWTRIGFLLDTPVYLPTLLQNLSGSSFLLAQFFFVFLLWLGSFAFLLTEWLVCDKFDWALRALVKVSLGLLFLPVTKKSIWGAVFNRLVFDESIQYHRWVGYWSMTWIFGHSAYWLIQILKGHEYGPHSELYKSHFFIYAEISVFFFVVILLSSLRPVRRTFWELFRLFHFSWIPAIVFACLHAHHLIYFLIPGLVLLIVDYAGRIASLNIGVAEIRLLSVEDALRELYPAENERGVVLSCDSCLDAFVVIEAKMRFRMFWRCRRAASWVQTCVPAVNPFGWHPLSVVPSDDPRRFFLIVRRSGNWCRALFKKAQKAKSRSSLSVTPNALDHDESADSALVLNAESGEGGLSESWTSQKRWILTYGVFGGMKASTVAQFDSILLVGGGCGIAPLLSILRMAVDMDRAISRSSNLPQPLLTTLEGSPISIRPEGPTLVNRPRSSRRKKVCLVWGVQNDEWAGSFSQLLQIAGVDVTEDQYDLIKFKIFIDKSNIRGLDNRSFVPMQKTPQDLAIGGDEKSIVEESMAGETPGPLGHLGPPTSHGMVRPFSSISTMARRVLDLPPNAKVKFGLPRLRGIFNAQQGKVLAVACGPQILKEMVRRHAYELSNRERIFVVRNDEHIW